MVNQTNPYNQIEKIGENREGERGWEREREGERFFGPLQVAGHRPNGAKLCAGRLVGW